MSTGQGDTQIVKLHFHRASNLPGSLAGLRNYFVALKTSGNRTDRTEQRRGKNPEWNKEFLCEVKLSSPTLSIDVFRIGLTKKVELVAIASLDVARCLYPLLTDILDGRCLLLSPVDHTPFGKATIFYSCTLRYHDGRAASELTPSALQNLVQGEVAIPKMITSGDAGLAAAVESASSNVTKNIIDILGKIDRVGQIITEVHLYAKLAWTVLNAAHRAIADQIERDNRIHCLWETIKTTVDLVDPLGKLKDMPLYRKTVEAILKQVYECVLFLRWYADKGFGGRFTRDTLSDKTNSAIEKYEKAFQDLWKTLQDGFSVDNIMQTYRLVAATERRADIAEDGHLDHLPGAALRWNTTNRKLACLVPGRSFWKILKNGSTQVETELNAFYGCLAQPEQGNRV